MKLEYIESRNDDYCTGASMQKWNSICYAVHINKKEDFDNICKIMKNEFHFFDIKELFNDGFERFKENTCLCLDANKFSVCNKKHWEDLGYKVLNISDIDEFKSVEEITAPIDELLEKEMQKEK